jgi:hypothetical protein
VLQGGLETGGGPAREIDNTTDRWPDKAAQDGARRDEEHERRIVEWAIEAERGARRPPGACSRLYIVLAGSRLGDYW